MNPPRPFAISHLWVPHIPFTKGRLANKWHPLSSQTNANPKQPLCISFQSQETIQEVTNWRDSCPIYFHNNNLLYFMQKNVMNMYSSSSAHKSELGWTRSSSIRNLPSPGINQTVCRKTPAATLSTAAIGLSNILIKPQATNTPCVGCGRPPHHQVCCSSLSALFYKITCNVCRTTQSQIFTGHGGISL